MPTSKVRVREFDPTGGIGLQYHQEVAIGDESRPLIPQDILDNWSATLNNLLQVFGADLARIIQVNHQGTRVIHYRAVDPLYLIKEPVKPLGLATYSETIIGTNGSLYLQDARTIPLWKENYDQHQGWISILGMPLEWPGHETFGTLEILSKSPLLVTDTFQDLFFEISKGFTGDLRQLHLEQRLDFFSTMDPLTSVHNRRVLEDWINTEFFRVRRTRSPFSIGLVHIKNLKSLNKEYGRPVADSTLEEVAQLLVDTIRNTDEIGRWSDTHFMILCPDTGEAGIKTMGAKVSEALTEHHFTEKVAVDIECNWEIVNGHEKDAQAVLNSLMQL